MDLIPFIQFTLNTRFIMRWVAGGLIFFIPFVDFFSIGYLSKVSRTLMIGSIGLPTWEKKGDIWMEGVRLLFIFILYEAVPFFLFSFGFFLTALHRFTAFFGQIVTYLGFVAMLGFSFFIPFAFAVFSEQTNIRKALEFEKIFRGIKEVLIPYVAGYISILVLIGILFLTVLRIPYFIGFFLFSVLTYYVLLIGTYYYAQLFVKTSLSVERIGETL